MRQIHVAYAIARKGGTHYRARAAVVEPMDGRHMSHSFTIAIDDDKDVAEQEAIYHVKAMYRREGMEPPNTVVSHGKLPGAIVDNLLFLPRGAIA